MKIDRTHDGTAWEYADPELNDIAILWILDYQFNLAAFDDVVEGVDTVPARRLQLLQWRQRAIDAQRIGNDDAAEGWVRYLDLVLRNTLQRRVLIPAAEHGAKMERGRKVGAVGPLRKAIRRLLAKRPDATSRELWDMLKERPSRALEFWPNARTGDYFRAPDGTTTTFESFKNAVSRERKCVSTGPIKRSTS